VAEGKSLLHDIFLAFLLEAEDGKAIASFNETALFALMGRPQIGIRWINLQQIGTVRKGCETN
jgi:hypothetical protein